MPNLGVEQEQSQNLVENVEKVDENGVDRLLIVVQKALLGITDEEARKKVGKLRKRILQKAATTMLAGSMAIAPGKDMRPGPHPYPFEDPTVIKDSHHQVLRDGENSNEMLQPERTAEILQTIQLTDEELGYLFAVSHPADKNHFAITDINTAFSNGKLDIAEDDKKRLSFKGMDADGKAVDVPSNLQPALQQAFDKLNTSNYFQEIHGKDRNAKIKLIIAVDGKNATIGFEQVKEADANTQQKRQVLRAFGLAADPNAPVALIEMSNPDEIDFFSKISPEVVAELAKEARINIPGAGFVLVSGVVGKDGVVLWHVAAQENGQSVQHIVVPEKSDNGVPAATSKDVLNNGREMVASTPVPIYLDRVRPADIVESTAKRIQNGKELNKQGADILPFVLDANWDVKKSHIDLKEVSVYQRDKGFALKAYLFWLRMKGSNNPQAGATFDAFLNTWKNNPNLKMKVMGRDINTGEPLTMEMPLGGIQFEGRFDNDTLKITHMDGPKITTYVTDFTYNGTRLSFQDGGVDGSNRFGILLDPSKPNEIFGVEALSNSKDLYGQYGTGQNADVNLAMQGLSGALTEPMFVLGLPDSAQTKALESPSTVNINNIPEATFKEGHPLSIPYRKILRGEKKQGADVIVSPAVAINAHWID